MNNNLNNKTIDIFDVYVGHLATKTSGIEKGVFGDIIMRREESQIFVKNNDHALSGYTEIETGKTYYMVSHIKNTTYIEAGAVQLIKFLGRETLDRFREGIDVDTLKLFLVEIQQNEKKQKEEKPQVLQKRY